jgi:hypothetical protein
MSSIQHPSVAGRAPFPVRHVKKGPTVLPKRMSRTTLVLAVGALLAVIAVSVVVPGTAETVPYPPYYRPIGGVAGPTVWKYAPHYAPHGGLAGPSLRMYSPYYAPTGGFAGPSQ